jgi:hypothetical protein
MRNFLPEGDSQRWMLDARCSMFDPRPWAFGFWISDFQPLFICHSDRANEVSEWSNRLGSQVRVAASSGVQDEPVISSFRISHPSVSRPEREEHQEKLSSSRRGEEKTNHCLIVHTRSF